MCLPSHRQGRCAGANRNNLLGMVAAADMLEDLPDDVTALKVPVTNRVHAPWAYSRVTSTPPSVKLDAVIENSLSPTKPRFGTEVQGGRQCNEENNSGISRGASDRSADQKCERGGA